MWVYLVLLVNFLVSCLAQEVGPVLTIEQGNIVGQIADDGDYWTFLGIPYAGNADGDNRFKAPISAPTFEELFFANRKNIRCVQPALDGVEGIEDCLVLNIFTPTISDDQEPLPVMVWVQGEELESSKSNQISYKHLVEQDVVIVTVSYRQSVFGFLCLGIEEAPGNVGMKDIIAALKWVKKNIAKFNGDPDNVTIFGHGTSAAIIDLVSLSPLADGLFHKIITQSGYAIAPWAVKYDPRVNARHLVEKLGHDISSEIEIVSILKRTSVAAIMGVLKDFDLMDNSQAFGPCIENLELIDEDHVLTDSPVKILEDGNYDALPYLTGFVSNEGSMREQNAINSNWLEKMESNFEDFIQPDLEFEDYTQRENIAEKVKQYYFQSREVDTYSIKEYLEYHGDSIVVVPAIRNAWIRASTSDEPVYLYQFSYDGSYGKEWLNRHSSAAGVGHGEELAYLFDFPTTSYVSVQDEFMKNILIERWTNFAKSGSPFSKLEDAVEWMPVEFDNINYLHMTNSDISDPLPLQLALVNPQSTKMTFWDQIYDKYYRKLTSVFVDTRNDEDDEEDENSQPDNVDVTPPPDNNPAQVPDVEIIETPNENNDTESSAEKATAFLLIICSMIALNMVQN